MKPQAGEAELHKTYLWVMKNIDTETKQIFSLLRYSTNIAWQTSRQNLKRKPPSRFFFKKRGKLAEPSFLYLSWIKICLLTWKLRLHRNKAVLKRTIFEQTPVEPQKKFKKNLKTFKTKLNYPSRLTRKNCFADPKMQYETTKPIKHKPKKTNSQ